MLNTAIQTSSAYFPMEGIAFAKAFAVRLTPFASLVCHTSVTKIASAVSVQTTKVSIAGPNIATRPSRTGCAVFAAP